MNSISNDGKPSAEFRDQLERELIESIFDQGNSPENSVYTRTRPWKHLFNLAVAAVVVLVVGMIVGASVGQASADAFEANERVEHASILSSTKNMIARQLELAVAERDRIRLRVENGSASVTTLNSAEGEVAALLNFMARIDEDLSDTSSLRRSPLALLSIRNPLSAFGCNAVSAAGDEQTTAIAQQAIPVVDLSQPIAKTRVAFSALFGIKETANSQVLINDGGRRIVRLFEPDLTTSRVVLDSAPGTTASYGNTANPLLPFVGDSSLFREDRIGMLSSTLRVLDSEGRVARALAVPPVQQPFGSPVGQMMRYPSFVDDKGRIIYKGHPNSQLFTVPRGIQRRERPMPGSSAGGRTGGVGSEISGEPVMITDRPDSIPIHRLDFESRKIDTVGFVSQPPTVPGLLGDLANGGGKMVLVYGKDSVPIGAKQVINPVQTFDEWAVLSDGTIAFVRGRDYHVDWIHPDGRKSSTSRLPLEWKQLSEDDKQRLIDSTRARVDSVDAWVSNREICRTFVTDSIVSANGGGEQGLAVWTALRDAGKLPPGRVCDGDAASGGNAGAGRATGGNGGRGAGGRSGGAAGRGTSASPIGGRRFPYELVPPSKIADYYPPFLPGAVLADRDGNLWILPRQTSLSRSGELVYDVVNPTRGLHQRVRLPLGRSVAGFGKGGVVYLQSGDIINGFSIEKVRRPIDG